MISHHCDECGNALGESCSEHPGASVVSVVADGSYYVRVVWLNNDGRPSATTSIDRSFRSFGSARDAAIKEKRRRSHEEGVRIDVVLSGPGVDCVVESIV